jgi:hypothetical protein
METVAAREAWIVLGQEKTSASDTAAQNRRASTAKSETRGLTFDSSGCDRAPYFCGLM